MVTIGVLVKPTGMGLGARALRCYEALGLIQPTGGSGGGYRMYRDERVRWRCFMRCAPGLGCACAEVAASWRFWEGRGTCAADVWYLTRATRRDSDRRLLDRERMKQGLGRLNGRRRGQGPAMECPIPVALNAAAAGGVAP